MSFQLINHDYFRIYWALVSRDVIVIKKRYKGAILDAVIPLCVDVVLFGSLFPLMGIPPAFIGPIYLGGQTMAMFFLGASFGFRNLFDIRFNRFISYRLTLPLPKRWLFASYLTYFVMEALLISAPLLIFGIILLGPKFHIIHPQWLLLVCIYFMSLILYGLMFLGFSLHYEFDWYMANLWPRRLSILLTMGPLLYNWKSVYDFVPTIAYIMLLNPVTYAAEGLRSTLIGGPTFIPAYICIPMLGVWISISIFFVAQSIYKRLDPL